MRVIIVQPALPAYRVDFFKRVAERLDRSLMVLYSPTAMGDLTNANDRYPWASPLGAIRPMFPGADWQPGVMRLPIMRDDIIVVSGSPRNLSNMLMLFRARWHGAKTIWWGQYWSGTSKKSRFLVRLWFMKFSDAVLFYTDREVEEYRHSNPYDARLTVGLNNGINIDPIAKVRFPYNPLERSCSVLFIGRLTEKAELSVLLRAMVDGRLADTTLEIIGDGPQRESLWALSQDLGVNQRVIWHGGIVDEARIAEIANKCRLFVYPGGVGLSLLHAMAYGLPAILHHDRWRHMPEIAAFENAQTGLAFSHGDPNSLADAISRAMADPNSCRIWSDASRRIADHKFNTKEMADRFCTLISRLEPGLSRD